MGWDRALGGDRWRYGIAVSANPALFDRQASPVDLDDMAWRWREATVPGNDSRVFERARDIYKDWRERGFDIETVID